MARLPRFVLPGQPQHIILRGNNRSDIFAQEDDYRFFKACLAKALQQHECELHAYVLMTNHVHLLLTPRQQHSISKMLQSVGRRYVQNFNYTQQRTGTLWEGRYKATPIDSERYLLTCYRYIEMNPVRAGMVEQPGAYPWSSHLHNATGANDLLVTEHELYTRLGRSKDARQQAYCALFESQLTEGALAEIRAATNKGWALGDGAFRERLALQTSRRTQPLAKGRPRKVTAEGSLEDILNIIK